MAVATTKHLGKLHRKLTKVFLDVLKNGEVVEIEDEDTGELVSRSVTPDKGMLNLIRQFLKDNGIEAVLDASEIENELTEELPFDEGGETPDNIYPLKAKEANVKH